MKESAAQVRSDCPRCRSTGSIEFGICQVCLAPTPSAPHTRGIPQRQIRLEGVARVLTPSIT